MAREKNKHDLILSSASKVFAQKGFHDANIIEIAKDASIGKGTIYEYFDSKMTLYIEVIKFNMEKYLMRIRNQVMSKTTFDEKLEAYINCHTEIISEHYQYAGLVMNGSVEPMFNSKNTQETLLILLETRDKVVQIILDILVIGSIEGKFKNSHLEYYADLFFEMLNRSALRALMLHHTQDKQTLEKTLLIQMLINGIGH